MRVLILCAGDQTRWRDENDELAYGVPKQMAEVDGEPILRRTVRLLRERGVTDITVVHKPREGGLYRVPGVKTAVAKLDPTRFQADRFFSSRHLWSDTGRTVILYGDVYFSEEAIDTIVADRAGWWAYGRPGPSRLSGCRYGEIFAFSWTPETYGYVDEHMRRLVDLQAAGVINRSLGWELYRSLMGAEGTQVRRAKLDTARFVVIDDWTEDFDKPADLESWLARRGTSDLTLASVVVPTRLDTERQRLWDFLRPRWEALGWQVIECDADGADWSKGAAVAAGVQQAVHDIVVVSDADVWCDGVTEAVERVRAGAAWALPHYMLKRLSKPATQEVLATGQWPRRRTPTTFAQAPYPGRPGGGMVVLPRESYWRVPIDPRFVGWGQEDESWALALGTLLGRSWRGTADLWHLYHHPMPRQSRAIGSMASLTRHRRYAMAHHDRRKMAALVAEYAQVPA